MSKQTPRVSIFPSHIFLSIVRIDSSRLDADGPPLFQLSWFPIDHSIQKT